MSKRTLGEFLGRLGGAGSVCLLGAALVITGAYGISSSLMSGSDQVSDTLAKRLTGKGQCGYCYAAIDGGCTAYCFDYKNKINWLLCSGYQKVPNACNSCAGISQDQIQLCSS